MLVENIKPNIKIIMDDKNKRGGSDRKRIDVNTDYELRDWSEKFNVSREELKKAVEAVGTYADDVEEYLKK
jgi:polynucleotide 5'-kinase involved in rRNA processing